MIERLIARIKAWLGADAKTGTRKTGLEKIASGLPARSAAAMLAAKSGGAAFLLPVLLQTLAGERQAARLQAHFGKLEEEFSALGRKIDDLTDAQFKLVAEIAESSRLTVDDQKLELLRLAVRNALNDPEIVSGDVDALARLVRDLSVAEMLFIVENFRYFSVRIEKERADAQVGASELLIRPGDPAETVVSGLIGHGLLYAKGC